MSEGPRPGVAFVLANGGRLPKSMQPYKPKRSQVARVIHPDGQEEIVRPAQGTKFTLEELQKLVGGYIELVTLPRGNGRVTAYVNEDGLSKELPFNYRASQIYQRGTIVGPMVIVSREALCPAK